MGGEGGEDLLHHVGQIGTVKEASAWRMVQGIGFLST
jgi:hypothetical protein